MEDSTGISGQKQNFQFKKSRVQCEREIIHLSSAIYQYERVPIPSKTETQSEGNAGWKILGKGRTDRGLSLKARDR